VRWIERIVIAVAALRALRPRPRASEASDRVVPAGPPDRRAETVVIVLLLTAALSAAGFVVAYSFQSLAHQTQLLGLALGLCLALVGIALIVVAKRLVVTEELEEGYPDPHPQDQATIARTVADSGSRFTRKRLLVAAGGTAGTALAAAAITPALSLGPALDTRSLYEAPWRRGRRLVDREGVALRAADVAQGTFYTAYPEGADRDEIGAPLVVIRLDPARLRLPRERSGWAPEGILAYSKVCTHAGCAIALYRKPLFPPVEPPPGLVCPCHYSTFDPATGGTVVFGPAGRDLPQLPLLIDAAGHLRAAGPFSGPVGPSWRGVRTRRSA
jgi:ubiquinol-cytochrome c reductase iron-sulfur subunit